MTQTMNWYPGHMKKTKELIEKNLSLVDFVIEITDARIPYSSRNPLIDNLIGKKPRVLLLNKIDLASPEGSQRWKERFEAQGISVIFSNAQRGTGIKELTALLEKEKQKRRGSKGNRPFRMMIVGIPNVGKSSLINRLVGKKAAAIGNRPGVTRGKQWLTMKNGMEILDTPGILWPKFEDPHVATQLAFCGSIKEEVTDVSQLALDLVTWLSRDYPGALMKRYAIQLGQTPLETLEEIGAKRGCLKRGNVIDYERVSRIVLEDFRGGQMGKFTLDIPPQ